MIRTVVKLFQTNQGELVQNLHEGIEKTSEGRPKSSFVLYITTIRNQGRPATEGRRSLRVGSLLNEGSADLKPPSCQWRTLFKISGARNIEIRLLRNCGRSPRKKLPLFNFGIRKMSSAYTQATGCAVWPPVYLHLVHSSRDPVVNFVSE